MAIPYPSSLPEPLYRGKQDLPSQTWYLTQMDYSSKRRAKNTGQFIVNLTFQYTEEQVNVFWGWYLAELNSGVKLFEANWDIAGVRTILEFGFSEQGQPKITPTSFNQYEVQIKVEVKSDIFELLASNNLNGWCPDITDCLDNIIKLGVA